MKNPVYLFRVLPSICLVLVGVMAFVPRDGFWFGLCLGANVGLLIGLISTAFRVKDIQFKDDASPIERLGVGQAGR